MSKKYIPELETILEKGSFPEFYLNAKIGDNTIAGVPDYFYENTFVEFKTAKSKNFVEKLDKALLQLYLYDFIFQIILQKENKMKYYCLNKDIWIVFRDKEEIFKYRFYLFDVKRLAEMLELCSCSNDFIKKTLSSLYGKRYSMITEEIREKINQIMISNIRENPLSKK